MTGKQIDRLIIAELTRQGLTDWKFDRLTNCDNLTEIDKTDWQTDNYRTDRQELTDWKFDKNWQTMTIWQKLTKQTDRLTITELTDRSWQTENLTKTDKLWPFDRNLQNRPTDWQLQNWQDRLTQTCQSVPTDGRTNQDDKLAQILRLKSSYIVLLNQKEKIRKGKTLDLRFW